MTLPFRGFGVNKLKEYMQGKIEAQKTAGAEFMAQNISKDGVKELPGGIQYEIIKEGTGAQPLVTDTVKAHYKGTLLDGKEFDNSFKRGQPFSAPLRALIKGWQVALPMMKEGSHWRLWIPSDLAYGDRGAGGNIPGGATLIFEVELLEIVK
jgi:FKBP-type peptidyl-prolyl cis-trans isomerase FklB